MIIVGENTTSTGLTVGYEEEMHISNGGVANSTTVDSYGRITIFSGGVADSTTVDWFGEVHISSGGVANSTTVNSYGYVHISSGGVANSTTVNFGYMCISSGGVANNTTVNEEGTMHISSGGVANSTTVDSGYMEISSGGVANDTTVSDGWMNISSGGVANDTTVDEWGFLGIDSGGVANSTVVNSSGTIHISSGGVANDTVLSGNYDTAVMHVLSGGVANSTMINAYGSMFISSGGVANNTTVNSGGSMHFYSGGVANSTTLNSGGSMYIYHGVANDVVISSGAIVSYGGMSCWRQTGETAASITQMTRSGITGIATNLNGSGNLYISSGGVANSTTLNSGSMYISSGGVANSTTLYGGYMDVCNGGVANNTTVNSGGNMYISSGGIHRGHLKIENGAIVSAYQGAIIDFTVAEQKSADTALINDISRISGNSAVYTLTVSANQASGDYVLAGNAAAFDKTITVKTDEAELGKLTVGDNFTVGGVVYSLHLVDSNLTLTLDGPPELDVSLNQNFALDYEFEVKISEPASLQYKIDNGEWQDVDGTTIAIAQNGTYSFQAEDLTGNMSEVVTKEISGLVFGNPEKVETDGGKTSWTPVKDESGNVQQVVVQYSVDNFKTMVTVVTSESALKLWSLPDNVQWRVKGKNDPEWEVGEEIAAEKNVSAPQKIESVADGVTDIFFARTAGRWTILHQARHQGIKDGWTGTQEIASLDGKSKIVDVFSGADDANVLYLTDGAKGDALFVDDIYADSFEGIAKTQARIANLDEIRAGAGDDVVDMTSQRFDYVGDGVTIYGGDGDDVIWSNKGNNKLFGDAGNDHIVGASGNDVIVGGAGDDTLHGGGGNDIFCFGDDWGIDTVEQLSGGTVTLWFEDGSEENWNADTRTYTDGENTVTVSGTADVTLKFGGDISSLPDGIFSNAVTKKIFESTLA